MSRTSFRCRSITSVTARTAERIRLAGSGDDSMARRASSWYSETMRSQTRKRMSSFVRT
jgi:hypothetical protein